MNKLKPIPFPKKLRAWEYLNSLPRECQDQVWDYLLDQPVHEIIERLLRQLAPNQRIAANRPSVRGLALDYSKTLPAGSKLREVTK